MNTVDFRQSLAQTLADGAAAHIAHAPEHASAIAKGIKTVLDELAPATEQASASVVTDEVVNRFLAWQFPGDFAPDGGIEFKRPAAGALLPTGTNLLHFGQAKAMLEHCLNGPSI